MRHPSMHGGIAAVSGVAASAWEKTYVYISIGMKSNLPTGGVLDKCISIYTS